MTVDEAYEVLARALGGLASDVRQALARLEAEVERGRQDVDGARTAIGLLVDLLASRGELNDGHRRLLARAGRAVRSDGRRVHLQVYVDKYSVANNAVDCLERLPLCLMRCCSFRFALTTQDVEEGKVRWDLEDPYTIRQEVDGYCTHFARTGSPGCTVYEHRPAVCRTYTCRNDARVWLDFERRIPAAPPRGLHPPPSMQGRLAPVAEGADGAAEASGGSGEETR